jgi:hypothetical protein
MEALPDLASRLGGNLIYYVPATRINKLVVNPVLIIDLHVGGELVEGSNGG